VAVDTRKITIEIIGGGSGSEKNKKDTVDKELNPKETKEEKTGAEIWLNMVAQRALSLFTATVESSSHNYFYMKEDYLGEQIYRNVKSNISKVSGSIITIAAGAKIGGAPGAVIATVGVVANEGLSIYNKYASLENQMNTLNYGMEFSRTRAGLVDNGRGTEN
jgi:hypothetical protein